MSVAWTAYLRIEHQKINLYDRNPTRGRTSYDLGRLFAQRQKRRMRMAR